MKAEDRGMLVRGRIIFGQWRSGCISLDRAKDDNVTECTVVYTPWHSHDDLEEVDKELAALQRLVGSFRDVDGAMIDYEYKKYRE